MAKYDEIPRGQLSSIILMCLTDKDKYGYEIIDEVLSKTNGRMSIKQPSLYSSLKRMEEQSLISSYWRDSEIGGRRHYYHLTDLGRKNLEKWQTNFSFSDFSASEEEKQDDTRVLQQTNLFSLNNSDSQPLIEPKTETPEEKNDSFIQFDLFSNRTIVTPPSVVSTPTSYALPSSINMPEKPEQKPIVTEYEKPEELSSITKFDYIKKSNKSFADKIKSINNIDERKFVEQKTVKEDNAENAYTKQNHETLKSNDFNLNHEKAIPRENTHSTLFLENLNNSKLENFEDVIPNQIDVTEVCDNQSSMDGHANNQPINPSINFVQNLKNNEDYTEQPKERVFVSLEQQDEAESQSKKINISNLPGYMPRASESDVKNERIKDDGVYLPQQKVVNNNAPNPNGLNESPKEKKDDGVIITERLELKDIPKQPKFEARRFEVYISDDSLKPKLQNENNTNYEERIKDLYEKSKSNAENQELEIIDSKIKFSSYSQLQDFYSEQNIKFKPYKKSLHKTGKDFDMIKISKLNLFTSLSLLCVFSVISLIIGLILTSIKTINTSFPLIFASIPAVLLVVFIVTLISYERSPQKRIAYDINKFKFNISMFAISIAIIPIVLACNMIFGFNFNNFGTYAVTIIYPSTLSLVYLAYYFTQRLLIKFKSMY